MTYAAQKIAADAAWHMVKARQIAITPVFDGLWAASVDLPGEGFYSTRTVRSISATAATPMEAVAELVERIEGGKGADLKTSKSAKFQAGKIGDVRNSRQAKFGVCKMAKGQSVGGTRGVPHVARQPAEGVRRRTFALLNFCAFELSKVLLYWRRVFGHAAGECTLARDQQGGRVR